jgi:nucleoside-diphosphate-sugar epimerase
VRLLVTGAGGFIGQTVARALLDYPQFEAVQLVDRTVPAIPDDPRFSAQAHDLSAGAAIDTMLADVDAVIHLAAIPGGSAEADPVASRRVNIDATLRLLEHLDGRSAPARFVYASSIAVFGEITRPIDDDTRPAPTLVYGTHKRMVELALADFHRRGRVSTIALRLPGIVARPRGNAGLRSAFMSDVFHAAAADEAFVMPVGPEATMWIMSAARAAENLIRAALLPSTQGQALTLPALRITAEQLVTTLYADPTKVQFARDIELQRKFGAFPPLATPAAEMLGFSHDGSLDALVAAVR